MKIVIANSVGIGPSGERYVHFPSRWSAVEEASWYDRRKGKMTFYPFMLAYLSSLLKRDTSHDVTFLDGNLNDWAHDEYLLRIIALKPDWLVMETSTLAFNNDIRLANAVKETCGSKVIFTGQHPSAFPKETLAAGVDHVCIGEYEFTVLELLQGGDPAQIKGLYPNPRRELTDPNLLPWPEDDDVRRIDYIEPVVNEYRELEIFSSRGCPLACNFCVAANVYYGGAGSWRPRDVNDVVNELSAMKEKYPEMEGAFFDDEVHNGRKDFVIALCKAIIDRGLDTLKYNAMCGYWNMDREMLGWMKRAGYYKLRVGIETGAKDVAVRIGKSHSLKKLYSALEAARDAGIKVYGTFTYGASGATPEKDEQTTALIKDLLEKRLLFDLQISICTPQPGTPFFKEVEGLSALTASNWSSYDGGRNVVQDRPDYPASAIESVVAKARRTATLIGGGARFANADYSSLRGIATDGMHAIVIGSGPKWQTDRVLAELVSTGVTCDPLVRNGLLEHFIGRTAYGFSDGPLSRNSLPPGVFNGLVAKGYDLAVIQVNHNNQDLSGYKEVFRLATMLGKKVIGVNVDGGVIESSAFEGSSEC